MPVIKILPHEELCPQGAELSAAVGETICNILLANHIAIEHACEKSCACTTCHIVVRAGGDSLNEATEEEEDMLDKAWGLETDSRLSCQTLVGAQNLIVEIPKYTVNLARENH